MKGTSRFERLTSRMPPALPGDGYPSVFESETTEHAVCEHLAQVISGLVAERRRAVERRCLFPIDSRQAVRHSMPIASSFRKAAPILPHVRSTSALDNVDGVPAPRDFLVFVSTSANGRCAE
jgi:hypothetical protein